jgi:hypothetical protein
VRVLNKLIPQNKLKEYLPYYHVRVCERNKTLPGLVAQWLERRSYEPNVASSILARTNSKRMSGEALKNSFCSVSVVG